MKVFGVVSMTVGTMHAGGMILSRGIMMILFPIYIGQVEIEPGYCPQFLMSLMVGFSVFAALCLSDSYLV